MFVYVASSFQIQGPKVPGCKQAKSHDEWDRGEMMTNFWGVPATNLWMAARGRKRVRGPAPMVVVLWCLLLLGWLPGLESEKKKFACFFICGKKILIWLNEMEDIFLIVKDFALFRSFQLLQHRSHDQSRSFWEAKNGHLHWPHFSLMLSLEFYRDTTTTNHQIPTTILCEKVI